MRIVAWRGVAGAGGLAARGGRRLFGFARITAGAAGREDVPGCRQVLDGPPARCCRACALVPAWDGRMHPARAPPCPATPQGGQPSGAYCIPPPPSLRGSPVKRARHASKFSPLLSRALRPFVILYAHSERARASFPLFSCLESPPPQLCSFASAFPRFPGTLPVCICCCGYRWAVLLPPPCSRERGDEWGARRGRWGAVRWGPLGFTATSTRITCVLHGLLCMLLLLSGGAGDSCCLPACRRRVVAVAAPTEKTPKRRSLSLVNAVAAARGGGGLPRLACWGCKWPRSSSFCRQGRSAPPASELLII